jgi:hypothetical protein
MPARHGVVLVCVLLVSYAYFFQAGGWNQNSRFDLVRALVERGTTRIDAYVDNTGDRALVGGHAYSDKAPGQALTAVPLAAIWTAAIPPSPTNLSLLAYSLTVWAAGLPTAIAAASLAWSARALGSSRTGALVAALAFGVASPAWIYATLLWGHALTAGCLTLAFAAAVALRQPGAIAADASPSALDVLDESRVSEPDHVPSTANTVSEPAGRTRDLALAAVVGASAGWAVVTEYPAAPAAAILLMLALVHARGRLKRIVPALATAFALTLAVLPIYNVASFGAPTFVSYAGVQGFAGMSEGLFGVTLPKRTILQEILFGQFRGLLPLAPAAVLAPIGLILLWRSRSNRPAVAAATAVIAYYLLFNSAYYYWDGGFSYGPRHIGAALPFVFLGLAPLWTSANRLVRAIIALTIGVGAAFSLMAVSTLVQLPEDVPAPLRDLVIPAFLHADLAQNRQSFLQSGTANPATGLLGAWNLGQLLGLPGLTSLLPLLILWAIALGAYFKINFSRRRCS